MYTVSSRLRTFSIALIIIGLFGIGYGFITAPKTVDDVKEMMHSAEDSHGATTHNEEKATDAHAMQSAEDHGSSEVSEGHGDEASHYEHVLSQAQNRPWTAIYIPMIFFLLISVCALVFYAIQRAASAGWSPVLFRVMEGVTGYIVIGSVIILVFLAASAMHANHMFAWMFKSSDPTAANFDFAMETKEWWLNVPWFLIRSVIYVLIWIGFRHLILKNARLQEETGDMKYFKKSFKFSVIFLVMFLASELFMAFDWLMSIDYHWFSQLYSFYVFASMFVSAITVIALVTIYLRAKGLLPQVNDSHIHDLAKYMFAFSIFWTYLWYAQFMLQWYANIPEEAAYFHPRLIGDYQPLFMGMVILNFVFPILILMNSDYKRIPWFVVFAGIIILVGHYLDVFVMVSPGTVGNHWSFGIPEIGALLFFAGLFILVVFSSLAKKPLEIKKDPFIKESEIFHY
ncbi:quinol:cytochrome C oxidoreductase [Aureibaculum marinum]|uniref:Quinol:cytochrome C oxidoreductase n=1 Tax=Aureibaculum marinum TaxID=2487930 RepID=A0A3N4NRT0_9FLAO|nr:quinol:cytochrome C oxidoreductase [Aureibaculum marinum]RPD99031.1 quinol:cytochrome C oxidoreductase [Aureibaculum marinum]